MILFVVVLLALIAFVDYVLLHYVVLLAIIIVVTVTDVIGIAIVSIYVDYSSCCCSPSS